MITIELALALREAGLSWLPRPGDRFVLPHRDMDAEVFVLSDMTVEVHDFPSGAVIGFNGVTEWALDSVQQDEALWLPVEHQLRACLGGLFVRLEHDPGAEPDAQFVVTLRTPAGEQRTAAAEAELAYAAALLAVLQDLTGAEPA